MWVVEMKPPLTPSSLMSCPISGHEEYTLGAEKKFRREWWMRATKFLMTLHKADVFGGSIVSFQTIWSWISWNH